VLLIFYELSVDMSAVLVVVVFVCLVTSIILVCVDIVKS